MTPGFVRVRCSSPDSKVPAMERVDSLIMKLNEHRSHGPQRWGKVLLLMALVALIGSTAHAQDRSTG
jgi:hypothetical protein